MTRLLLVAAALVAMLAAAGVGAVLTVQFTEVYVGYVLIYHVWDRENSAMIIGKRECF